MRFLCLHGRGTNSDIFESQLAPFFSQIPLQHTFDFLDAQSDCPAAPGISEIYPGPYLAWLSQYAPEHIKPVHDYLRTVIEEDGPYDGVIGFSEGAALAASFLLSQEARGEPSPFKLAVFFNAVMLLSPSEKIGCNIEQDIKTREDEYRDFLMGMSRSSSTSSRSSPSTFHSQTPISVAEYLEEIAPTVPEESIDTNPIESLPWDEIFGFPPEKTFLRIKIPTLHVIGTKDQFVEHSMNLVKLCRLENAEVVYHIAGHELPRKKEVLAECAELFEVAVMTAGMGSL